MWGAGLTWEVVVPSVRFCCEPKSSLKRSLFKRRKNLQFFKRGKKMKMLKQSHTTFVLLFLKVHRKVWKDIIMIFIEPCSHDRHQPFKCIILFNSHQDDATQVKKVGVIFNFLLFSGNLSSYSLTTENSDCFSGAHFRLLFFFLICLPWVLVVACEI